MINEKYLKDLEALEKIARQQGDKINLSIILITLKCVNDELVDIFEYFFIRKSGLKLQSVIVER